VTEAEIQSALLGIGQRLMDQGQAQSGCWLSLANI